MKKKFSLGKCYLNKWYYLLFIRQCFGTYDRSDLDRWPSDPKINTVPLLPRIAVWTKF